MQNSIALATSGTVSGLVNNQAANAAFETIATNFTGPVEPAITYAGQWWFDTTADAMKQRNADNTAWVVIFSVVAGNAVMDGGAWS